MGSSLIKNTFREIKDTKARFISIMLIVALGVGFFAGIKCTNPSMQAMADRYYRDNALMDFRLLSNVGFDDDDVKAVKKTEGIKSVMPSYFTDVKISSDGSGDLFRIMSIPKGYDGDEMLNIINVKEGRLPENSGEIALENAFFSHVSIGEKMVFEEFDDNENLKRKDFTVVGIIQSPMYISFERGTTNVGNGKLSGFAYIKETDFAFERYTELYARADYDDTVSAFSDEYSSLIDDVREKLEKTSEERENKFKTENIDKAQKEIDENREKYEDEKKKTEEKLKDAKKELDEGESTYYSEISKAKEKLNEAQRKIENGESQLYSGRIEYENGVKALDLQLKKARSELDEGKKEYEKALALFEENKEEMENGISALKEGIMYTASGALSGVIQYIPDEDSDLKNALAGILDSVSYDNASMSLECACALLEEAGISDFSSGLLEAQGTIAELNEQLAPLQQQYDSAQKELSDAKAKLESGENEYKKAKEEGEKKLKDAKKQLDESAYSLSLAKTELENGKKEYENQKKKGLEKLDDAKKEYEEGRKKADKELSDAKKKLDDAQKELDDTDDPKWYVFDRDDNPGYSTFIENCYRVDNVAVVFPLFFLLVAMLVCLTTMTRLIEEKRTEIGTFKALGYNTFSILLKFIVYSSLAAVLGSLLGCTIGISVLPRAIYACYGIMYDMPDISIVISKINLFIGILASIVSCVFVSIAVCMKVLRERPSMLMRPKAPRCGKRILLERITFIWKRLDFTSKVTQRNLFRYKSRLFMTVIGIAGCTALIVAGFGLYDSISDVVGIQYRDLNKYNISIVSEGDKNGDFTSLENALREDERIEKEMLMMTKSISVTSKYSKSKISDGVYLSVPGDVNRYDEFQTLRNRITKKDLKIEDGSAIITEKLAGLLSVKVGDTVYLDSNKDKGVKISGIAENYIYGYIFISPKTCRDVFDRDFKYNLIYVIAKDLDEKSEHEISADYLKRDDVQAVSVMRSAIQSFEDTISSMKMITFILVVCAGALALVVLYNLTNINLTERRREIATIKVLGFRHGETASFVYRENIILTVLGIIFGLILGIFLTRFIVTTVEIDKVMFGRTIYFTTFLYAALGTVVFSAFVNFIMYFRIKKIDMIESLKSVE